MPDSDAAMDFPNNFDRHALILQAQIKRNRWLEFEPDDLWEKCSVWINFDATLPS
jgi:hypothetical protein